MAGVRHVRELRYAAFLQRSEYHLLLPCCGSLALVINENPVVQIERLSYYVMDGE
jgi:hypothetical protein